jgi:hypothetical protein
VQVQLVQVQLVQDQLVQVQMEGVRQVHLLEHLLEIRLRSLRPIKLLQETYENFDAPFGAFRQYQLLKKFPRK